MAGQTITNLGSGGAGLNGQSGSTAGADSNDPLWLEWTGTNYVYLPGTADNYLHTPDEAALDITGDIDLRAWIAADAYSGNQFVISKRETETTQSYVLYLGSNLLNLQWTTDGTAGTGKLESSTASLVDAGYPAGTPVWVRATLDVNNGAGGYDVKFYTSPDGATWTQLGSTVTGGATTSIYSSNSKLAVGSYSSGSPFSFAGYVYRAIVKNGIDGTTVLDIDTSLITSGSATTFTAVTGQTVTIGRSTSGRKSAAVTASIWLLGTDDYLLVDDNALIDFGASDSLTVMVAMRQWTTPASYFFPVSKQDAGSGAGYFYRNFDTQSNRYAAVYGPSTAVDSSGSLQAYTLGAVQVGGLVVDRSAQTLRTYSNGTLASTASISTVGSLANSLPLQIGRGGAFFGDFELMAVAVFRRALSSDEVTRLSDYYTERWI